jgi:hypothetical protein
MIPLLTKKTMRMTASKEGRRIWDPPPLAMMLRSIVREPPQTGASMVATGRQTMIKWKKTAMGQG